MQSRQAVMSTSSMLDRPIWLKTVGLAYKLPVAFFSGCLLGLSSPGFELWWLAWVGLVPLLLLIRGSSSPLESGLSGLLFGFGYHGVSLSWYLGLAPLAWLGLPETLGMAGAALVWLLEVVHQSVLPCLFALLLGSLPLRAGFLPNIHRPFYPYLFSVPLVWLFLQWVIAPSEIFIGLPINQLAYSQYKQLCLIQTASVLGSAFVDFLIVLVNTAIASLILQLTGIAGPMAQRSDTLSPRFGALADALVVGLLMLGLSTWGGDRVASIHNVLETATARDRDPQSPPVPVAVLQGNVSVAEERLKVTRPEQIASRYRALGGNLGALILFMPEGVLNSSQMSRDGLLDVCKEISAKQDKEVIAGSIETLQNEHVNAARLFSPRRTKEDVYVKRRLVPLGESAPIEVLNEKIPAPVRERIPATREKFMAADSTQLLHSIWGKVGLSIYIELVYPRLIADEVRKGASLLVNVSNLSWFHDASINRQLLAAAVFRAVENGRYLVLSTNTGVSAVITPSGLVTSMSVAGQRGVLLNTIQFLYGKTPFSRMWWL
ncbi:MAG: apolipoprotein N-acyltransferase [Candidatus Obscuribacterales bacterium]